MSDRTPLPLGADEIKFNVTFPGPGKSENGWRTEDAVRAYFVAAGFQHVDELLDRLDVATATELGKAVAESTTELAKSRDELLLRLEEALEDWDDDHFDEPYPQHHVDWADNSRRAIAKARGMA